LDAEVTACDHERVEGQHDLFEIVHGLGFFDLRDHRDAPSDAVHHLVDAVDVGGRTHEGQGDQIHPEPQGELEVVDVFVRQGGDGNIHPGQGQALVVRHRPTLDD